MTNSLVYYRLVALWVVTEAMLGGIIHGLKLPVSGLFVGGMAVIIICLMGFYCPSKGAIIRATIFVAIFKMMLSPQSPAPAYIAVFFQGLVGQLIFSGNKAFRLRCILFAVVALVESGIQRLLVMTVIYGMDIWEAINMFINGITGQESVTNYSYYLASGYVVLHLLAGIAIGYFAGSIPGKMRDASKHIQRIDYVPGITNEPAIKRKKKKRGIILFAIWLMLIVLFIHSWAFPEEALIPTGIIFRIIFRSALIILSWVVIVGPLLRKIIHRWLEKKKKTSESDIAVIMRLLPSTRHMVSRSWELSAARSGMGRLYSFLMLIAYNTLRNEK